MCSLKTSKKAFEYRYALVIVDARRWRHTRDMARGARVDPRLAAALALASQEHELTHDIANNDQ